MAEITQEIIDAIANVPALRKLGTAPTHAAAGDDTRFPVQVFDFVGTLAEGVNDLVPFAVPSGRVPMPPACLRTAFVAGDQVLWSFTGDAFVNSVQCYLESTGVAGEQRVRCWVPAGAGPVPVHIRVVCV